MNYRDSIGLAATALIWLSACGVKSTQSAPTGSACTWPASLNPPQDAGPWMWGVARYYLRCNDGNAYEVCLSNDPSTCPGPNSVAGGTLSDCVDQCNGNEYAVAAGYTLVPTLGLPAACRELDVDPGGVVHTCCPCE